jgi:hypothetical protein
MAGIGFIGTLGFLNLQRPSGSFSEKLLQIDYVAMFLFTASVTSFLIPITWGGIMYPWSDWHTLVPLLLGPAGLVVFITYESLASPSNAFIPLHFFKDRSTSLTYVSVFLHGVVLWCIIYYMPLYFEGAQGLSPVPAGMTSFPQTRTVVPCSAAVGLIATRTGKYRWAIWCGWCLTTLGCGLFCLFDTDTPRVEWVCINMCSGIGIGLHFSSLTLAVQASVLQEQVGLAVGLLTFFRAFGQSIGVVLGGVIFGNRFKTELQNASLYSDVPEYSNDAAALVKIINSLPSDNLQRNDFQLMYANSIRVVWSLMCGISGLALFLSFLIKSFSLDQALRTKHGFVGRRRGGDMQRYG